jgi:hypothetical protein
MPLRPHPGFDAVIGLHYGTVVGGVLDSGVHSEFTVIGDAVNVAQRLETPANSLDAPLVISFSLIERPCLDSPAKPCTFAGGLEGVADTTSCRRVCILIRVGTFIRDALAINSTRLVVLLPTPPRSVARRESPWPSDRQSLSEGIPSN